MKQAFPFISTVRASMASMLRHDLVSIFTEQYENGDKLEAFHTLLDFFNEDIRKKYGNEDGTEFCIPHGSVFLHIQIADDMFYLWVDFLHLPHNGRVAFLRELMNVNIEDLNLARIKKEGDLLKIEYHCSFAQTHPSKLFRLIGNICTFADTHDDEYCSKFGAKPCVSPKVTPYSKADMNRIVEGIKCIGEITITEVKLNADNRSYGIAWNVLASSLYQIYYFLQPQGKLQFDYIEELERFDDDDDDRPIEEVVNGGLLFLKRLMSMTEDELSKHLYHVEKIVSLNTGSSLSSVQERMNSIYEEVTAAVQVEDYKRCYIRIRYSFYESLYYFDMQDDIYSIIVDALEKSSSKTFKEASTILYAAMKRIISGKLSDVDVPNDHTSLHTGSKGHLQANNSKGGECKEAELIKLKELVVKSIDDRNLVDYISVSKQIELALLDIFLERKENKNGQETL